MVEGRQIGASSIFKIKHDSDEDDDFNSFETQRKDFTTDVEFSEDKLLKVNIAGTTYKVRFLHNVFKVASEEIASKESEEANRPVQIASYVKSSQQMPKQVTRPVSRNEDSSKDSQSVEENDNEKQSVEVSSPEKISQEVASFEVFRPDQISTQAISAEEQSIEDPVSAESVSVEQNPMVESVENFKPSIESIEQLSQIIQSPPSTPGHSSRESLESSSHETQHAVYHSPESLESPEHHSYEKPIR